MNVNVKELRIKAGMTQKAFQQYFKVPRRTYEDWEYNKRECSEYLFDLFCYKLINEGIIKEEDLK